MFFKYIFFFLLLIIDGITKYLATLDLFYFNYKIIRYQYAENPGMSFGLLSYNKTFLIIIQILLLGIFLYYIIKNKICNNGALLILAGGMGNIIFRMIPNTNGKVIDFINLNNYFIFNLADLFISTGVILYCYNLLKRKSPK